MSQLTVGIPSKVLRTAAERGMHADCVAAGADGLCDSCLHILYVAMDDHYGACGSVTAATEAYIADLLAEA